MTWEIKAAALHGTIETLRSKGLFDKVRAKVSPSTRAMLDEPPLRTAWVRCADLAEIDTAVLELKGPVFLRAFSRDAAMVGAVPAFMSLIQGMLRLFGASPSSLLERITPLLTNQTHNIAHSYDRVSERHGRFTTRYEGSEHVPDAMLVAFSGVLEIIFELCSVRATGSVSEPSVQRARDHTLVQWDLRW